jgi:hypothetical protein
VYPLAYVVENCAAWTWTRFRDFTEPGGEGPVLRFTTIGLLTGVAVICAVLASSLWTRRVYTTWPRWELSHLCDLNLRRIGLAMQNYYALYGSFPPAYLADSAGKPMHSWRVLLLPLLEEQALYDAYRFDEPWNGLHNRLLAERMPDVYRCAWDVDRKSNDTSYVVVVGPATVFPGSEPTKVVPDGTSNTLLAFEFAESGINWLEPRDLQFDQIDIELRTGDGIYPRLEHYHKRTYAIHGIFADGHRCSADRMPAETFRALLTANGGEAIKGDW